MKKTVEKTIITYLETPIGTEDDALRLLGKTRKDVKSMACSSMVNFTRIEFNKDTSIDEDVA